VNSQHPRRGHSCNGSYEKCRVLQVTPSLGYGGMERVAATIARNLDRDRFEVSFLCLRQAGPLGEELEAAGFRVEVLPGGRNAADYRSSVKVARHFRRTAPSVVHTHNTHALIDCGIGGLLAGRPALVHTDHARQFPDRLRYVVAEHLLSRLTYRMVGVSDHTTENLRRYERIPKRKLVTIPNSVDIPPFDRREAREAVRSELRIAEDDVVLGSAVRLTAQKGLTYLIEAFARLVVANPKALLVIAGTGPDHEPLTSLAREIGVADRVRFIGARSDVPRLLCGLDVYVLPSVWEGMPLGVLEAMAVGCPVVATRVGGVPEMIDHGRSGLIVPSRNVEALAAAIARVLNDLDASRVMAQQALERFQTRFSLSAMIRAYEELYLESCAPMHSDLASWARPEDAAPRRVWVS
jgi:glycosyltransferase involved in cell wall biosynthesis